LHDAESGTALGTRHSALGTGKDTTKHQTPKEAKYALCRAMAMTYLPTTAQHCGMTSEWLERLTWESKPDSKMESR